MRGPIQAVAVIDRLHSCSISSLLRGWAERTPDALALMAPGSGALTYAQLAAHAERHADDLCARGVGRADRMAMVLPQGPAMLTAFLAVSSVATVAPLNPSLDESAFSFWFSRVQPTVLMLQRGVQSPARAAAQRSALPVIELSERPGGAAGEFTLDGDRLPRPASGGLGGPEDVAMMLSTSGTTSRQQLVPLTHRNICAAAANTSMALGLTSGDRCLNVMPLFHGHGLVAGALASLMTGGSVVCVGGFEGSSFFRWLDDYRPTWYTAVPTMHRAILAEAPRHPQTVARSRLRFIRSASAPLPRKVMTDLEALFRTVVTEGYGLSEALQLTNTPLDPQTRKLGSLGVPGTSEIAVMDETHHILGPSRPGEIVCRGPVLMAGYYDDVEANERSFTKGWFRTGDLGFLDHDGHLYMTGRVKDLINRGGEKISPQEVDGVLCQCPHVAEACTFGVPHVSLGEDVAAAVVLRGGVAVGANEIRDFAVRHLPTFKVPRQILIVDDIPKGPTGKVKRAELAETLARRSPGQAARSSAPAAAPRSPLEHQVAAIWEELFDIRSIGPTDDFFELGGDSLLATALMAAIEDACGRVLPPSVLLDASTVAGLAATILRDDATFDEPLTALRASGARTPLFFVHNDYGRGLYMHKLARSLDSDRPVFAVHLHGLATRALPATVQAIATDRLQAVRAVCPHGPYALGGHCYGGVVALEMAHQLRAAGERVELVVLVDTPAPSRVRRTLHRTVKMVARVRGLPLENRAGVELRIARAWDSAARWAHYYHNRFRLLMRSGLVAQANFVWRKSRWAARQVAGMAGGRETAYDGTPDHTASEELAESWQAYREAIQHYVPAPYTDRVVLLRAEELPAKRPDLGWSRLLPHLEVAVVPGDHHTCITRHVTAFATHLEAIIQRAESAAECSASQTHTLAFGPRFGNSSARNDVR